MILELKIFAVWLFIIIGGLYSEKALILKMKQCALKHGRSTMTSILCSYGLIIFPISWVIIVAYILSPLELGSLLLWFLTMAKLFLVPLISIFLCFGVSGISATEVRQAHNKAV